MKSISISKIFFNALIMFVSFTCVAANTAEISAQSAGFEDGNRASIYINGKSIIPSGLKSSTGTTRGLYVAAINQGSGSIRAVKLFDTYGSKGENSALQKFLQTLPYGTIVVMAVKDEASRYLDVRSRWLIKSLGSRVIRSLIIRDSWCLIGRVGADANTAHEQLVHKGQGYASIYVGRFDLTTMRPSSNYVDINLLSAGFENGNTAGTLINGRSILTSPLVSAFTRGVNVAVFNPETGVIIAYKRFDTYDSSVADVQLQKFLSDRKFGQIVTIVARDEASQKLSRYSQWLVEGLGSRQVSGLRYRDSWCIIGRVGGNTNAVKESLQRRTMGFATLRSREYLSRPNPPSSTINIRLFSAGFESGNKAGIFINGVSVFNVGLKGIDLVMTRGLNVAIVNEKTGHFLDFRNFDTYGSATENKAFQTFIKSLHKDRLVLIVVKDEASRYLDTYSKSLISGLGSKLSYDLGFRDSWSMIGRVGGVSGSAIEAIQKKASYPAEVVKFNYKLLN